MESFDAGLRRVSVHSDSAVLDVCLPAEVPVAALIPTLVDLFGSRGAAEGRQLNLSAPGAAPLDPSTTLAQSRVDDGAVLVLSRSSPAPPVPRYLDAAAAVTDALAAAPGRRPRRPAGAAAAATFTGAGGLAVAQCTLADNGFRDAGSTAAVLAVVAVGFSAGARRTRRDPGAALAMGVSAAAFGGLAGFVAVPGAAVVARVLLGAAATAVTAVVSARLSCRGGVTLTAVACTAVLVALAALAGTLSGAPPPALGSAAALASVAALALAPRATIALAGLTARPQPGGATSPNRLSGQAVRADAWLTSLTAGLSASTAVGAVVTAIGGAPRPSGAAFAAVVGALLLARACAADASRTPLFAGAGTCCLAATVAGLPAHGPWLAAATAALAGAALHVGFAAPTLACSPVARRAVELLECVALAALVPLTGWICGAYAAARGLWLR
ncbi:type VII secretion integral membrane protein EccD [Mycobacterium sp. E1214]|uniref:type VII secretion integral membrane protein EccD n=1 Tax=Mycobacterium sp. E1214 TaxID=1834123 RepID=UPI0008014365|nr:type VII secretion integral membrane protein EccD [Mycobacterium sp. E1214]OBG79074.1 type VII secretion integral membrane protein EccD [Mycobacterium sp. E1214]